jgi:hypothetical protein
MPQKPEKGRFPEPGNQGAKRPAFPSRRWLAYWLPWLRLSPALKSPGQGSTAKPEGAPIGADASFSFNGGVYRCTIDPANSITQTTLSVSARACSFTMP